VYKLTVPTSDIELMSDRRKHGVSRSANLTSVVADVHRRYACHCTPQSAGEMC